MWPRSLRYCNNCLIVLSLKSRCDLSSNTPNFLQWFQRPQNPSPRTIKNISAMDNCNQKYREALDSLLTHVGTCQDPQCDVFCCLKTKIVSQHTRVCALGAAKGCIACSRMKYLIKQHSIGCSRGKACVVIGCWEQKTLEYRKMNAWISDAMCSS